MNIQSRPFPADGIGPEVIAAGITVLESLAEADGRRQVQLRNLRLGLGLLPQARRHDAGRRPGEAQEVRRDLLRRGRRARRPRPHHAVGPAAADLPGLRPIRQRPPDQDPARHHLAAAQRRHRRSRLGDRAREFRGRICRLRRPRPSGPAGGGRHRSRDLHPRRRSAHHALRVQAGAVASAQAADRRHQVERPAPRHGDVGRDRRRGRRRNFPT